MAYADAVSTARQRCEEWTVLSI